MSSSALKKQAQAVLDDIKASANKQDTSARKALEKQHGQILIINKKRFMTNLTQLVPQLKNNQSIKDEIWREFTTRLKSLEAKVRSDRLKELRTHKIIGLKATDAVFYVATYGTARRAKSSTLKRVIKIIFKKRGKELSSADNENLNRVGGSDNKFGAQLGHSESFGGQTVGFAASTVRAAAARDSIRQFTGSSQDREVLLKGFTQYERIIKVDLEHVQNIDAKGITKKYIPILSWQTAMSNQELAKTEATAIKNFTKYMKDVVDNEGSTKLLQGLEDVTLYELSSGIKKSKKKVTGTPRKKVKEKSKGSAKAKVKYKSSVNVVKDSSIGKGVVPKVGGAQQSLIPLASLIGPLNEQINRTVKDNMGAPRLVNRTGRFAGSVRVTDITATPQGFPSIGYTYQRGPYDVFESSPDRDPRKLIDRSIREIAAQFAIGRFYTRRV